MPSPLPNGKQQFCDANGNPLAGGSVAHYIPGTSTPSTTWSDSAGTIPNANPLTLDAAGEAVIWGSGSYRQVVKDSAANLIWDQVTAEAGASTAALTANLSSLTNATLGAALIGWKSSVTGGVGRLLSSRLNDVLSPFDFGAKGDGATDDTAALQAWLNALQAKGTLTEGAAGCGFCPSGYTFKTSASLTVSTPVDVYFGSWIYYTPTTGAAFIIGASAPVNGRNTGYRIFIAGLRATNGNTAAPTGINTSGSIGLEVRNMQFSTLEIGEAIAFTRAGIYLNSTNTSYSGQQIQDNNITLGQIAYNGYGVLALSHGAADGSVQANHIKLQNTFSNWVNFQFDNPTYNSNTNDNTVFINAMDACAPGGQSCVIYGSFNIFTFGFLNGAVSCQSVAFGNRVTVANPEGGAGAVFDYNSAPTNANWMATATPPAGSLPVTTAITPGTPTQNTIGVPVMISFSALVTPTSSASEVCIVYVGQSSGAMVEINRATVTAITNPQALGFPFSFLVPPGWFWQVSVTGSGSTTLSSARIYQAG